MPHVISELPTKYYLKLRAYYFEVHPVPEKSDLPDEDGIVDIDVDQLIGARVG